MPAENSHAVFSYSSHRRLHYVWATMRQRCKNPKCYYFKWYGARGISVCSRWESFQCFVEDMGEGKKGWTIERVNNDGNYEMSNCVWATYVWQNRNKRSNYIVTVRGITGCLSELCERFNVNYRWVYARLYRYGLEPEQAFLSCPHSYQRSPHRHVSTTLKWSSNPVNFIIALLLDNQRMIEGQAHR